MHRGLSIWNFRMCQSKFTLIQKCGEKKLMGGLADRLFELGLATIAGSMSALSISES